eukprot:CAMPEP_0118716588 /NCGR_PEP_ID=MMETSP0800-20121206/27582_1 /TAXON_ID=210618 ORGANISM="Striatella unipunctata, Strain CCMP2910" /NCGR_SAMPLE_ID=MMETSP0800 /ASSEMBLY_ACC=CAM_ASM_000638 /LENGTH=683 /DNA_ID=CAMNT_0006623021 /DNA_START=19 /DNA_END=2071 /DNA_ORIENTATION=-
MRVLDQGVSSQKPGAVAQVGGPKSSKASGRSAAASAVAIRSATAISSRTTEAYLMKIGGEASSGQQAGPEPKRGDVAAERTLNFDTSSGHNGFSRQNQTTTRNFSVTEDIPDNHNNSVEFENEALLPNQNFRARDRVNMSNAYGNFHPQYQSTPEEFDHSFGESSDFNPIEVVEEDGYGAEPNHGYNAMVDAPAVAQNSYDHGGNEGSQVVGVVGVVDDDNYSVEKYSPESAIVGTGPEDDTGGIQAFVKEEAVEAMGVAVLKTDEEQGREDRSRFFLYLIAATVCLVVSSVVLVTIIFLVFLGPADPTEAPTASPSAVPTQAPTKLSFFESMEYLTREAISSPEQLLNTSSPQYLAVEFVSFDDFDLAAPFPAGSIRWNQRFALAVFYFSTNGDTWYTCFRGDVNCQGVWIEGDECSWKGVTCVDGVVTGLSFASQRGNGLYGTLPSELSLLRDLKDIALTSEALFSTVPESFGEMSNLESLIISNTPMTGTVPDSLISNRPRMRSILLSNNEFSGPMPSFRNMGELATLFFDSNHFTGSILTELGSLQSLRFLRFFGNELEGTIPPQIFELTLLQELFVDDNKLNGLLSPQVSRLKDLKRLTMSNNTFTGPIPGSLGVLSDLERVSLENNKFFGRLPPGLSYLHGLRILSLANNMFTGTIPSGLAQMTRLIARLSILNPCK